MSDSKVLGDSAAAVALRQATGTLFAIAKTRATAPNSVLAQCNSGLNVAGCIQKIKRSPIFVPPLPSIADC